jgi:hypothetical protein
MNKIPMWFIVVAVVALFWNLIGAAAVIMNFMLTPEVIAALPAAQQQMYADTPVWSSYASLLAVITGSLGCVGLLMKKAWAVPMFVLSIVGLIVQDIAIFIIVDAIAVLGNTVLFMQGGVAIIAIGLLFLARMAKQRDWIA